MKNLGLISLLFCLSVCYSCSTKITTNVVSPRAPLDASAPVVVFWPQGIAPEGAEELGTVSIGDTGSTTNRCQYGDVIEQVKIETRAVGGNALMITEHKKPKASGSPCHQIRANILYLPYLLPSRSIENTPQPDSTLLAEKCAIIHIYRIHDTMINTVYDIYVKDEIIAHMDENSRESLKIKALGKTTFWAKTESRTKLTIDVKPGYHYYIRGSVKPGLFTYVPFLEEVGQNFGEIEYKSIYKID